MWGMIAKITLHPGKRDEMVEILRSSADGMPGCLSYVVANDSAAENVVWVTEMWNSAEDHQASLSLPAVRAVVPRALSLVANFERVAVTNPRVGWRRSKKGAGGDGDECQDCSPFGGRLER